MVVMVKLMVVSAYSCDGDVLAGGNGGLSPAHKERNS